LVEKRTNPRKAVIPFVQVVLELVKFDTYMLITFSTDSFCTSGLGISKLIHMCSSPFQQISRQIISNWIDSTSNEKIVNFFVVWYFY